MIINLIYRGFHFTLISKGYDMKKCLDFIAGTEEQTIANRIAMINTYNVSKVAKQVPYPLSFDRFYNQILPLTKNAIADFKQLVRANNANLPKYIADLKSRMRIKNFDKLPHNPDGEFIFKVNDKVKKLSRREWWTIGAANALSLMLYQVAGYITKIESGAKLNASEKQTVFENWNSAFVEYSASMLMIAKEMRKKSGKATHQAETALKKEFIKIAKKIKTKRPTITNSKLITEILSSDKYTAFQDSLMNILKTDNPAETVRKWLPPKNSEIWK